MTRHTTWVMHTLAFTDDDRVEDMKTAIEDRGSKIIECKGAFDHYELQDQLLAVSGPIIPYGSCNFMKWVTSRTHWQHFCDWDKLECTYYMPNLINRSIHDKYAYLTFAELGMNFGVIYQTFAKDNCLFIRPNSNDKPFHGQVIHVKNFPKWFIEHRDAWKISSDTLCMISEPDNLVAEWRVFVHNGRVISGSQYRPDWIPITPGDGEVVPFVEIAVRFFDPFPVFSLDIGLTKDGRLCIIEYGSVNCAGLYSSRVEPIVEAVEHEAWEIWNDDYAWQFS